MTRTRKCFLSPLPFRLNHPEDLWLASNWQTLIVQSQACSTTAGRANDITALKGKPDVSTLSSGTSPFSQKRTFHNSPPLALLICFYINCITDGIHSWGKARDSTLLGFRPLLPRPPAPLSVHISMCDRGHGCTTTHTWRSQGRLVFQSLPGFSYLLTTQWAGPDYIASLDVPKSRKACVPRGHSVDLN